MKNKNEFEVALREAETNAGVTECINMRVATASGRTAMILCPALKSITQGQLRPLAAFYDKKGQQHILLQRAGGGLTVLCGEKLTDICSYSKTKCAVAVSFGFVVMTDDGPYRIYFDDGAWSMSSLCRFTPEVILESESVGTLISATDPMILTNTDFSRTAPSLSEAAQKKLSAQLCNAYHRLAATAADGQVWFQPAMACYRLIGESGEIVYTSAPMTMSSCGWQARKEVSTTCTKNGDSTLEVPQIILSARAYRPKLKVSDSSAAVMMFEGIRKIELWMTPQLHPFDASQPAAWRITRESTAHPELTIAIPGATDDFSSRNNIRLNRLHRLDSMMDRAAECVEIIDLARLEGEYSCRRAEDLTPEIENEKIARLLDAPVGSVVASPEESLIAAVSSPGSFTAETVAVSGDSVVWGNITPLPATSLNVAELTADFSGNPFEGAIVSHSPDGSQSIMSIKGPSMPQAWAAHVSFPDPAADRLEIYLAELSGRAKLWGELPLEVSADGCRAIHIDPNLEQTPFQTWTGTIPDPQESPPPDRHPGTLLACSLNSPLRPLAAIQCCHSPIRAIHPALRSRSGWDFSKARFYAFSQAAIHAVSLSAGKMSLGAAAIDNRGIDNPRATVYTPLGVMALHRGNLLKVTSSKTETLMTGIDAGQIAWDEERQRIWLINDLGAIKMLDPATQRWSDIPSPADFVEISTVGNQLWLTDRDELYRPESESELREAADRRVLAWKCDIPLPRMTVVDAVEVRLSASYADFYLTLSGQMTPNHGQSHPLLKMRIVGKPTAPVCRRIAASPHPFLSLKFEGTCSPDLLIQSILLRTRKKSSSLL